jgi:hypothetical protein
MDDYLEAVDVAGRVAPAAHPMSDPLAGGRTRSIIGDRRSTAAPKRQLSGAQR